MYQYVQVAAAVVDDIHLVEVQLSAVAFVVVSAGYVGHVALLFGQTLRMMVASMVRSQQRHSQFLIRQVATVNTRLTCINAWKSIWERT